MSLGRPVWKEARATIEHLLSKDVATLRDNEDLRREAFIAQADVQVREGYLENHILIYWLDALTCAYWRLY